MGDVHHVIRAHWGLYFPFDEFQVDLPWTKATKLFRQFFLTRGRRLLKDVDIERATQVIFVMDDFLACCSQGESASQNDQGGARADPMAGFKNALVCNAEMTLNCLGLALCSLRRLDISHGESGMLALTSPIQNRICPRFVGIRPLTPVSAMKSSLLGRLVALKGNVIRVSGVSPMVKRMDFECSKCGMLITKNMPDGRMQPPTHCEANKCSSKHFKPDLPSAVTVDLQRIRIQEIEQSTGDSKSNIEHHPAAGVVPRHIDVELAEELVDLVVPGDVVTVTGIVKAMNMESISGKGSRARGRNREASLLVIILEANALESKLQANISGNADENSQKHPGASQVPQSPPEPVPNSSPIAVPRNPVFEAGDGVLKRFLRASSSHALGLKNDVVANLSTSDLQMIATVASQFDLSFLVSSFCPMILGNEDIKAGLLLALAGGTSQEEERAHSVRSDIHLLLVGDPGLGKSQMLKAAARVSARGVYVCGNSATKSGLTVTLLKDASRGHCIEAGALVLADRGVCCIDEFDKMSTEHDALLEAMEQQSISLSKAGIVCTLRARTSILAAANPIGGHYNQAKTIRENLRMKGPLLSRFDLIFILLDRPDQAQDGRIADYVVDLHKNGRRRKKRRASDFGKPSPSSSQACGLSFKDRLAERISERPGTDPLPPEMLKKYLAFAKHYCHPTLSLRACEVLQKFYLELRAQGGKSDSTPITTRQLESLIRLAQARAKLELREVVTEADARDTVLLLRETLLSACTDETGILDFSRSKGMSKAKVYKAFVRHITKVARERRDAKFTGEQLKFEAVQAKLWDHIPDFEDMIEVLNQQCYLLKKGRSVYQAHLSEFSQ